MGKLATIKTTENNSSVLDFINAVPEEQKRKDSLELLKIFEKLAKQPPKMWGSSIIGFGNMRYKSPTTDREVDWFIAGFSPRKANLTLYLGTNVAMYQPTLDKLGKYKKGGGCLYINKLSDVDRKVLEELIATALRAKK
jgi:hypothetical protein